MPQDMQSDNRPNLEKAKPFSEEDWGRALRVLDQKHNYNYRNIIQANEKSFSIAVVALEK